MSLRTIERSRHSHSTGSIRLECIIIERTNHEVLSLLYRVKPRSLVVEDEFQSLVGIHLSAASLVAIPRLGIMIIGSTEVVRESCLLSDLPDLRMCQRRIGLKPKGTNTTHIRRSHGCATHLSELIHSTSHSLLSHNILLIVLCISAVARLHKQSRSTHMRKLSSVSQFAIAREKSNVAHLVAITHTTKVVFHAISSFIYRLVTLHRVIGSHNDRFCAASDAIDGAVVSDVFVASRHFGIKHRGTL